VEDFADDVNGGSKSCRRTRRAVNDHRAVRAGAAELAARNGAWRLPGERQPVLAWSASAVRVSTTVRRPGVARGLLQYIRQMPRAGRQYRASLAVEREEHDGKERTRW